MELQKPFPIIGPCVQAEIIIIIPEWERWRKKKLYLKSNETHFENSGQMQIIQVTGEIWNADAHHTVPAKQIKLKWDETK